MVLSFGLILPVFINLRISASLFSIVYVIVCIKSFLEIFELVGTMLLAMSLIACKCGAFFDDRFGDDFDDRFGDDELK